mgnify:CR=1 FL=1|tara:strand:+ start:4262 stop:4900 length:639 start_codon:yes stop_codon:yes gene_type:complete
MNFQELKNIDLKNIDIKDLIEKFKNSEFLKDKKFLKKFGIYFGSILLFLIIYYAFINPKVEAQKQRINTMLQNEKQTAVFKQEIIILKKQVEKLQPEYEKKSKLFHSQKEVEGLYQNISNFASMNSLNIIKLNKESAAPVSPGKDKKKVAYFKIPVSYEITGNYLGYLKFRRALAKSNKVINFDREQITVVKDAGIRSVGTLSIVGLPDEYK